MAQDAFHISSTDPLSRCKPVVEPACCLRPYPCRTTLARPRARRNSSGWCSGSRCGSAARSSARGLSRATSRTPISRSIRARRRRFTACSAIRSPTGSRRARERARRCSRCKRCRPSRNRHAERWPKAQAFRCTRASRRRARNLTSSNTWRDTSQGPRSPPSGCR